LVSYGDLGSTNQVSISYQFDLAAIKAAETEDDEDYGTTLVKPAAKTRAALKIQPTPTPNIIRPVPDNLSIQSVYHLGIEAYKRKDYDQALVYFKKACEESPTEDKKTYVAEADVMLGVLYEYHQSTADHLAQAGHYYREALKLDPNNPTVQKHLVSLKPGDDDR
jgi:tetratricopeptide (TPR) repeat protein